MSLVNPKKTAEKSILIKSSLGADRKIKVCYTKKS
jgi:hypothetical protein